MSISNAYPDILQNGNPADASQVMANFYQIQNDVNANAANNGANSNITSLTGLTTALGVAYGGTGATTASAATTALGALSAANNLSDVASAATAATNLGLGTGNSPTFNGLLLTGSVVMPNNIGIYMKNTLAYAGLVAYVDTSNNLQLGNSTGFTNIYLNAATAAYGPSTPTVNDSSLKLATTAFVNPGNSQAASGYVELPSGIIFQWGSASMSAGGYSAVTFPVTFPSALYQAYGVGRSSSSTQNVVMWNPGASTNSYAEFAAVNGSTYEAYPMSWWAIGR